MAGIMIAQERVHLAGHRQQLDEEDLLMSDPLPAQINNTNNIADALVVMTRAGVEMIVLLGNEVSGQEAALEGPEDGAHPRNGHPGVRGIRRKNGLDDHNQP